MLNMDSEIIYEALGEVLPMEKKKGSKESFDEGFGAHDEESFSDQPPFNHSMTGKGLKFFQCFLFSSDGFLFHQMKLWWKVSLTAVTRHKQDMFGLQS